MPKTLEKKQGGVSEMAMRGHETEKLTMVWKRLERCLMLVEETLVGTSFTIMLWRHGGISCVIKS